MSPDLDKKLVEKYPKIFRDRFESPEKSCMFWGFEHGDGWYHIIDSLCASIQSHINMTRRSRLYALLYNRALKKSTIDNVYPLANHLAFNQSPKPWAIELATEAVTNQTFKKVPEVCPQVIALQVKEKYGSLRFYYHGGDDSVGGMVDMAEALSHSICQNTGAAKRHD